MATRSVFADPIEAPDLATKIVAKDGTDAAGYLTVEDVSDTIVVGEWNDTSAIAGNAATHWSEYFGNPGTGKVSRFNRVFVGVAAHGDNERPSSGDTWLLQGGSLSENAQLCSISSIGSHSIIAANRTSDWRAWLGTASPGCGSVTAFAVNDDLGSGNPIAVCTNNQAYHEAGCTGVTETAQFEVASAEPVTDIMPFVGITGGVTMALNLTCGLTDYTEKCSAALFISAGLLPSVFRKGIVVADSALDISVGGGGAGVAMEMARSQSIRWVDNTDATVAEIFGNSAGFHVQGATAAFTINAASAAEGDFYFADAGAAKWALAKPADNSLFLYSFAASAFLLKFGAGATPAIGFFGATPVAKPTGVTVDAAGIHAALVSLGLIAA